MTRRNSFSGLTTALLAALVPAACGPADVTIQVALDGDPEPTPIESVAVQLLPYDRDQIFDSLVAAAATPEPQVPPDLLAAQDEVAAAQQAWRDADARWNDLRASVLSLTEQLEELNPAEAQYHTLHAEFEDADGQLASAEREQERAFENFTGLQGAIIGRSDSMSIVLADWEDQVFADVNLVIAARIEEAGIEPVADTTDVAGFADFQDGVAPGNYWVYARYELPYEELYWNVPITVTREEPFVLRLRRDNAEVRPIF